MSVEFDNLMDEDLTQIDTHQYGAVMTDQERRLLSERKFHDIVQYQRQIDAEIEKELREQEEQLRMEEEAFYEAKRQAARVGRRLKSQELAAKQAAAKKSIHQTWLGKDAEEYEIGSEDFQQFLDDVRKRSLNSPARTVPCQALIHYTSTETHSVDLLSNGDRVTESKTQVVSSNVQKGGTKSEVKSEVKSEASSTNNSNASAASNDDNDWAEDFVSAAPVSIKTGND